MANEDLYGLDALDLVSGHPRVGNGVVSLTTDVLEVCKAVDTIGPDVAIIATDLESLPREPDPAMDARNIFTHVVENLTAVTEVLQQTELADEMAKVGNGLIGIDRSAEPQFGMGASDIAVDPMPEIVVPNYTPKVGEPELISAWGTLEDMADGAVLLNHVIEERKKEIGVPTLSSKNDVFREASDFARNHEPGKVNLSILVGQCPAPQKIEPGVEIKSPTWTSVPLSSTEEEIKKAFADMQRIQPKEIIDDASKMGYWSMRLPSMRGPVVEKATMLLRSMIGDSPLTCAYVDSPEAMFRFDFRTRKFSGYRLHQDESGQQALWRGVCNSRRQLRQLELAEMAGSVTPYPEDVVQFTENDPDALIVPQSAYGKPFPVEHVNSLLGGLKIHLLKLFSYRGLWISVKKSRNDMLMLHNCSEEEGRARQLLCEMIGYEEYKKYLKRGFIVVRSDKTGWYYVIRGGHSMIECYSKTDKGVWYQKDKICIQFDQYDLPHTDGIILRKLMVEHDEFALRKKANVQPCADIEYSAQIVDTLRMERREKQKNPVRQTGPDGFLTWKSQQDPIRLRTECEEIARNLTAAMEQGKRNRQLQEQRAG